jgi:hypothetical protein
MKINKYTIKKIELTFDESIPTIPYKLNVPLLINQSKLVVLGNSLRDNIGDEIEVIEVPDDDYIISTLKLLELEVVEQEENTFYKIETEVKKYLRMFVGGVEEMSLFGEDELEEDRLITAHNFNSPPEYHFDKKRKTSKKKKQEAEDQLNKESLLAGLMEELKE